LKKYFVFALALALVLFLAACGNNCNTSSQDIQSKGMNLTQIQAGDYSSLQGTWTEVAYAVNYYDYDDPGVHWKAGTSGVATLSVSTDRIVYNDMVVIQKDTLTVNIDNGDPAGSHPLSFWNNGSSLEAELADADVVAINWGISFFPKGVENDLRPDNDVTVDNTKNLIVIWTSNMGATAVFAQTDTSF